MHQPTNSVITKFLMTETGTYDEQFIKPYTANLNGVGMQLFLEQTNGGQSVTIDTVSGIASEIIRPSAMPIGQIPIIGGWGERRMRFLMEVETSTGFNLSKVQVITGYTSHAGISWGNSIDPNMQMYINNIISANVSKEQCPQSGLIVTRRINDASHVFYHPKQVNPIASGFQPAIPDISTMMPEDIIGRIGFNGLNNVFGNNLSEGQDFRGGFNVHQLRKSRRANGLLPSYLARTVSALQSAQLQNTSDQSFEMANIARSQVRENHVWSDDFLKTLMATTAYSETGFVRFGDIEQLFPETHHVLYVIQRADRDRTVAQRGQSEQWSDGSLVTQVAQMLCQAIPSLMMDNMLTGVKLQISNITNELGEYGVRMYDASSFSSNVDMDPMTRRFHDRLVFQVLRDVTRHNQHTLVANMSVDILGDTFIEISVDGCPMTPYQMPTFCDALLAPVLTAGTLAIDDMATQINQLVSATLPQMPTMSLY